MAGSTGMAVFPWVSLDMESEFRSSRLSPASDMGCRDTLVDIWSPWFSDTVAKLGELPTPPAVSGPMMETGSFPPASIFFAVAEPPSRYA